MVGNVSKSINILLGEQLIIKNFELNFFKPLKYLGTEKNFTCKKLLW